MNKTSLLFLARFPEPANLESRPECPFRSTLAGSLVLFSARWPGIQSVYILYRYVILSDFI